MIPCRLARFWTDNGLPTAFSLGVCLRTAVSLHPQRKAWAGITAQISSMGLILGGTDRRMFHGLCPCPMAMYASIHAVHPVNSLHKSSGNF